MLTPLEEVAALGVVDDVIWRANDIGDVGQPTRRRLRVIGQADARRARGAPKRAWE